MTATEPLRSAKAAINASWERCSRSYGLQRDVTSPILRLQSTEVGPRREALIEQTGGRQGIFRQLASVATRAGHCLVVTDRDGILVRLETKGSETNWHGIALGSVWDERVAGTNGVSMALAEESAFTVRGRDHYYAQLAAFTCSAVPLRDAHNAIIGAASLSSMKTNSPSDDLFAQQLLRVAADRLQTNLFLQAFKEAAIVSVAIPGRRELIKESELVAVDEAGTILGATAGAHDISGFADRDGLMGQRFDAVFGADVRNLDTVPGRVMSVRRDHGPMLDVWMRTPAERSQVVPGWRPNAVPAEKPAMDPSLKDLGLGSVAMKVLCDRVQAAFAHGLPILLEGETGTGKSALVQAVVGRSRSMVCVDCAALDDTPENRTYVQSLMEQTRIADTLEPGGSAPSVLVFDNIDELPDFGQVALRSMLSAREGDAGVRLNVIATSRISLREAVASGRFRDDLYYLIGSACFVLVPLRERERADILVTQLASGLAGHTVEISADAMSALLAHHWPGNLRELRGMLKQALVFGDGRRIGSLDLALPSEPAVRQKPVPGVHLNEEQALRNALQSARWNVSKAARHLGIGRATIHRKMKALGITRPA